MSPMFSSVVEYLLTGCALATLYFLFRNSIDRRKGAIVEVAAVTIPLALVTLLYAFDSNQQSPTQVRAYLSNVAQIEFLVLPIFVAIRIIERLRNGESIQLADLFRITTVAAVSAFVFSSIEISKYLMLSIVCLGVYFGAEWSLRTREQGRNLALVFVSGFLLLIFFSIALGIRFASAASGFGTTFSQLYPVWQGLAIVALVLPQVLAPSAGEAILRNFSWFHVLALRIARWQQSLGNATDLIFVRTVFDLWHFRNGVCFLNHGSFGAVPVVLRNSQQRKRRECEQEPMDWLARHVENAWLDARFKLAVWLGTQAENIAFCENATAGMNEIAHWFPLSNGDEVLLNDHEYGAVKRIWNRRCKATGATMVTATLPMPLNDPQQITDAILASCNGQTKLVVLSHITSPTAIKLPVEQICSTLRTRGIATCIDGPHALLQEQFRLYNLQCDFYTASCHKWLCAPLGSGFVYIDPKWHSQVQTSRLSWGRLQPNQPKTWTDELMWTGTRDFSAYLSVPDAIEFFAKFDLAKLDGRNHALACYARRQLLKIPGTAPVTPEGRQWFGWMVGVWLPKINVDYSTLQQRLWERYRIEVPIVKFGEHYLVRVSAHLYTSTHDIEWLVKCLSRELSSA